MTNELVKKIAELCLRTETPTKLLGNVMFEMANKLPDTTNEKVWNELGQVFIRNRKSIEDED